MAIQILRKREALWVNTETILTKERIAEPGLNLPVLHGNQIKFVSCGIIELRNQGAILNGGTARAGDLLCLDFIRHMIAA